jgi:hypothetical protein
MEEAGLAIRMDGLGMVFDNIFVEQLWRPMEYAHIYLKEYGTVRELEDGHEHYIWFYNYERPYRALM